MNIQDESQLDELMDRSFEIIASTEFQDIVNQKLTILDEKITSLADEIEEVSYNSAMFQKVVQSVASEDKESGQEKNGANLKDQSLVDQLLAEFGVNN